MKSVPCVEHESRASISDVATLATLWRSLDNDVSVSARIFSFFASSLAKSCVAFCTLSVNFLMPFTREIFATQRIVVAH